MGRIFAGNSATETIQVRVEALKRYGLRIGINSDGEGYGKIIASETHPFVPPKERKNFLKDFVNRALAEQLKWIVDWWLTNKNDLCLEDYRQGLTETAENWNLSLIDNSDPVRGLFKKINLPENYIEVRVAPALLELGYKKLFKSEPVLAETVRQALEGHRKVELDPWGDDFEDGNLYDFILEYASLHNSLSPDEIVHDDEFNWDLLKQLDSYVVKEALSFIAEQYTELDAYEVSSDRTYFSIGRFFLFVVILGHN